MPPDIMLANWYALKCTGQLVGERSIWNLDPVERFIAPDDLYEQLLAAVNGRIIWGHTASSPDGAPIVSTAPLSETIAQLRNPPVLEFRRAPICVQRFTLAPGTDVHQTVYFPDPELALYRASITGRTLILEYAVSERGELVSEEREAGYDEAMAAFGIRHHSSSTEPEGGDNDGVVRQRFGKITPIADDAARKHVLFRLTQEHNIYSLGRFATWRNILLDDVVKDIDVIKRLMRSGAYERRSAT